MGVVVAVHGLLRRMVEWTALSSGEVDLEEMDDGRDAAVAVALNLPCDLPSRVGPFG